MSTTPSTDPSSITFEEHISHPSAIRSSYQEYLSGLAGMLALIDIPPAACTTFNEDTLRLSLPDPTVEPTHDPERHPELAGIHHELLRRLRTNDPNKITLGRVATLDAPVLESLGLTEDDVLELTATNIHRLFAEIDNHE